MAWMSGEATQLVERLIEARLNHREWGPSQIEKFMATKDQIATEVVAKFPSLTESQVRIKIATLMEAQYKKTEREMKRYIRGPRWWDRWF
jgi:hypothetical protein